MNSYLSPWHIFAQWEGMPIVTPEIHTPEIYYS